MRVILHLVAEATELRSFSYRIAKSKESCLSHAAEWLRMASTLLGCVVTRSIFVPCFYIRWHFMSSIPSWLFSRASSDASLTLRRWLVYRMHVVFTFADWCLVPPVFTYVDILCLVSPIGSLAEHHPTQVLPSEGDLSIECMLFLRSLTDV